MTDLFYQKNIESVGHTVAGVPQTIWTERPVLNVRHKSVGQLYTSPSISHNSFVQSSIRVIHVSISINSTRDIQWWCPICNLALRTDETMTDLFSATIRVALGSPYLSRLISVLGDPNVHFDYFDKSYPLVVVKMVQILSDQPCEKGFDTKWIICIWIRVFKILSLFEFG